MKYRVLFLFLLIPFFYINRGYSQSITNEGTDFWFAFNDCWDGTNANYKVHITSKTATSGTIFLLGVAYNNFTTAQGQVTTVLLPITLANRTNDSITNKAIHIVSNNPISVFASTVASQYRSEATIVLPTPALGTEYIISTKPATTGIYQGNFTVVAAVDSCTVSITSAATVTGICTAGVPYQVSLDSGQVYQLMTNTAANLSGSIITAVNGTDIFAVFSGHNCVRIPAGTNMYDPLYEAEYPVSSWGKEYIIPPIEDVLYSFYQVVAQTANTDIYVDGIWVTSLNKGQFYEDTLLNAKIISGSKPIKVMHYMPSGTLTSPWPNTPNDPSMALIGPNEQMFLDSITFPQLRGAGLNNHYVNVVTRTVDTATIQLNGVPITGWTSLALLPDYSYRNEPTDTGAYTLTTSGCGFLAYAYGMKSAESYYYSVGIFFSTPDDSITTSNITGGGPSNCINDSMQFVTSTGYGVPINYSWYFGDGDSSSLAAPIHQYTSPGGYLVTLIIDYSCLSDTLVDSVYIITCGNIQVNDTNICQNDSVLLIALGSSTGYNWVDSLTFAPILSTDSFYMVAPAITTTYAVYNATDTAYVTVTINPTTSSTTVLTECDGFSITVNGNTYTTTGIYTDTIVGGNFLGCDSIVTTDLTITPTFC